MSSAVEVCHRFLWAAKSNGTSLHYLGSLIPDQQLENDVPYLATEELLTVDDF